jgi:succinate dehydrogenase assembly factor 1
MLFDKPTARSAAAQALAERRRKRLQEGGAAKAVRHSGMQIDVLSLYKSLLKEAQRRTDAASRVNLAAYIRGEFRDNMKLPRKEVSKIEWLVHRGRNKLEELQAQKPNTRFNVLR